MGRKKTRRDFLHVPPATNNQSVEEETAPNLPGGCSRSDDEALMMHLSHRAMASEFEIRFPGAIGHRGAAVVGMAGEHDHDLQLALETLESLDGLEEQISFFRQTSEISHINLLAAQRPVEVEPELFGLLRLAKEIWRETEGAFDITSTPLWQAWGFARRAGSVPSDEKIAAALSQVGFQFVELDDQRNTIHFSRLGMQLNLGSIGKGYALDRCAARLIDGGLENFLLRGGQSSILAHGRDPSQNPSPHNSKPDFWTIGVPHPGKSDCRVAEIRLRNRAIGTSSSRFQSFRHEGKLYGHVIDPRTGRPAEEVLSATVVAPSAALADALSTAFYVLGLEKSLVYCKNHPEIGGIFLTPATRGGDVEIHFAGLNNSDCVCV